MTPKNMPVRLPSLHSSQLSYHRTKHTLAHWRAIDRGRRWSIATPDGGKQGAAFHGIDSVMLCGALVVQLHHSWGGPQKRWRFSSIPIVTYRCLPHPRDSPVYPNLRQGKSQRNLLPQLFHAHRLDGRSRYDDAPRHVTGPAKRVQLRRSLQRAAGNHKSTKLDLGRNVDELLPWAAFSKQEYRTNGGNAACFADLIWRILPRPRSLHRRTPIRPAQDRRKYA